VSVTYAPFVVRLRNVVFYSVGAIIYAWTSIEHRNNIPWIAPCIGITIFTVGLFHVYLAVFNYLADGMTLFPPSYWLPGPPTKKPFISAYLIYASSALSGQSFLRNIMAAAFPLFTRQVRAFQYFCAKLSESN
jgi:hypothetical protein